MSRRPDESIDSRILGCMLGGAVGDALGAPVEFLSLGQIRRNFGSAGIEDYAPAYGGLGRITDDTQMALFTAEGLLRAQVRASTRGVCHAPSVVQHAYLRWLVSQGTPCAARVARESDRWPDGWLVKERGLWDARAPGGTCLSSLAHVIALGDLPTNDSKGCGTVMRVAPVGILTPPYLGESCPAFELGIQVSRLTHGHPTGYLAGGYLAQLVALLVHERMPLATAARRALEPLTQYEEAAEVCIAVERAQSLAESGKVPSPELVESLGAGWTAEEAVGIALYSALAGRDFRQAVLLAVNHSGDSDSTGAIAGNIVGASLGVKAIPTKWLDRLELADVMRTIAGDLARIVAGSFDPDAEFERYPGW